MISHRHPDICADETRGRAIPPARAGADPRPGNNGVAPGEQDGTGKTGLSDRRRDLPDLMRRTGAGIPRAGQPISGLRAGPERVPSREGFFAAGHAGIPAVFFNRRYRANSGATPSAVSPRVSGRAFRFGKIPVSFQISVGKKLINGVNVLPTAEIRNETKCKKIGTQKCISAANDTHEPSPPGRTRDFRTTGATPGGGSQHAVPSVPGGAPLPVICKPFRETCIPRRRHRAKRRCDLPTPDECRNFCQAASHTSRINGYGNPFKFT